MAAAQENRLGKHSGMIPESDRVKILGIYLRHAPLDVSDDETDIEKIKNANITPEGEEQIRTETVPYLIKKITEEPDRKTAFLIRTNKDRARTLKTAGDIARGLKQALRTAGLSGRAIVIYRDIKSHAEILDTTPPLAARVELGDTKRGAAINWIQDNEATQALKGIEPPGSIYNRIKTTEAQTYNATLNKQIAVNQKKHPGRVRLKQGPRFSAPRLDGRKVTVVHVGVTHENFHGAILKNVASIDEAVNVAFLEPLEIHPAGRGEGVIYSAPKRGSAYPVKRTLPK